MFDGASFRSKPLSVRLTSVPLTAYQTDLSVIFEETEDAFRPQELTCFGFAYDFVHYADHFLFVRCTDK